MRVEFHVETDKQGGHPKREQLEKAGPERPFAGLGRQCIS